MVTEKGSETHPLYEVADPVEAKKPSFRLQPNMIDYAATRRKFSWTEVEKEFSWSKTGKVNMAYEAIDRHAEGWRRNKVALYYIDDNKYEKYTFQEMKLLSNKFANVLKKHGIGKGERVFLFMPRSPELYMSFMGILKVGAIPAPLFEAFMAEAVKDRIADAEGIAVITVPHMKARLPVKDLPSLKHMFLVGAKGQPTSGMEIDWDKEMDEASDKLDKIEWLGREDPLILHYTSGSTGKPKGVIHIQNAMLGHLMTARYILDLHEEDIYWCTSDPGWVTGTSYGIFGPWLNGVSNVIRGGKFDPES